jgi:hypothetical protein
LVWFAERSFGMRFDCFGFSLPFSRKPYAVALEFLIASDAGDPFAIDREAILRLPFGFVLFRYRNVFCGCSRGQALGSHWKLRRLTARRAAQSIHTAQLALQDIAHALA